VFGRHDARACMSIQSPQTSIASIPEGALVSELVADPHWRQFMLNIKGMPSDPELRQQVSLSAAPGSPKGDVDILLVCPKWPAEATAIEVKRIKFGQSAFSPGGQPNKLREYEKAVSQANRLEALGFHQVYLYVLVVVDSRSKNRGTISYEGLSSEQRSLVESTVSLAGLHEDVGLVVCTLVQPMDYPPRTIRAASGDLKRLATARAQGRELSDWLVGVLE
jgi:hypothetical protein